MNKIFAILLILISICSFSQNVGINETGTTPDISAMLDIQSNNKGLLIPRMTDTMRINIINPAKGLLVYQTNGNNCFFYYDGSKWQPLCGKRRDDTLLFTTDGF